MDYINSFFNNIKDKLTNPFFGTLIAIVLIHHWELWYSILSFDSDCTLEDKIFFIKNYIEFNLTLKHFLIYDVVFASIIMTVGYFITVGTRSLSLFIEFKLMPIITGRIVSKKVVRKEEYDKVVNEREQYFDQYEEQRKNVRLFSKTIDQQTEQIKQKDLQILELSNNNTTKTNENRNLSYKIDKITEENDTLTKEKTIINKKITQLEKNNSLLSKDIDAFNNIFFDPINKTKLVSHSQFPPTIIEKVKELKRENLWDKFIYTGNFYSNGGTLDGRIQTIMVEKKLAYDRSDTRGLTPLGEIIYRYRHLFEDL